MTVFTPRLLVPAAAGGRLTLTISRATCASVRRGTLRLRPVLNARARLNAQGQAVFGFRPPRTGLFYLGRLRFGGTALVLPGTDAPMYLKVFAPKNNFGFVSPSAWGPCP